MRSPPRRSAAIRYGIVCLLAVAVLTAAGVATADTSRGVVFADPSTPSTCEYDDYSAPRLGGDWTTTEEDALTTDSQAKWDGGRVVQVGAAGDCSLFVDDGETATLTTVTVNGTRGVVTGTVDLGAEGQFRLVDASGRSASAGTDSAGATATRGVETAVPTPTTDGGRLTSSARGTAHAGTGAGTETAVGTETDTSERRVGAAATGANATGLVIANDGPDFATTAVVAVGNRSEPVTLPTGRFFDVAVQRTGNGSVRVAVWDPDEPWDGEWDARFEDAGTAEWRVGLRGRAFLDGVAVGVAEVADTPGDAGPTSEGTQKGSATPTDDAWPGPGTWPGGGGPPDEPEERGDDGGSGGGSIFLGLLLVAFGALGVKFAYAFTLFGEQLDAIGSKRRASEVEPAEWNVAVTRLVAAVVALVGLYLIATGVL